MRKNRRNRRKLSIGQKVRLPKLKGIVEKSRPATVIAEYPTYYVAKTKAGYLECIPAYGPTEVRY